MYTKAPCKECPRKGCGAYHDKCKEFAEYKAKLEANKKQQDVDHDFWRQLYREARRSGL